MICCTFSVGTKHPKVHLCDLKSGSKIHVLQGQWTFPQHVNILQILNTMLSLIKLLFCQQDTERRSCLCAGPPDTSTSWPPLGRPQPRLHSLWDSATQPWQNQSAACFISWLLSSRGTSSGDEDAAATDSHQLAGYGYSPHMLYARLHMIINHLGLACCGPRGPKTIL